MYMIMAVDRNWAIGYKNDMLIHIPEDLNRFKEITTGNVLVCGKDTFISTGKLEKREMIVVSSSLKNNTDGVYVVRSIIEMDELIEKKFKNRKIFLIGGAKLIDSLIKKVDTAYITYIDHSFKLRDRVMHNLDTDDDFILSSESGYHEYNGIKFTYREYTRKKK